MHHSFKLCIASTESFFRLKSLEIFYLYQDNKKYSYLPFKFFNGLNSLKSPNHSLSSEASGIRDLGFTTWGCGSKTKLLRLIYWFKSYSLSTPKNMNLLLLTTTIHSNWEGIEYSWCFLISHNSLKERHILLHQRGTYLTSI